MQVKKNIAFAQEMMSIANPKAKALLYTVAAEKMKQTLFTLLKVDMKRGMLAWKTATHQLRLQVKASKLIKLLGIRNILVGLDNIICRKLTINILRWKEFTITRTMEIQKENFVIAAIKIQSAIRGCIGRRKCFGQLQRRKYQKLYDATIKLQACFRSKLYRWKYLSELLDIRRQKAATLAQRIYFGFKARKRVKLIKLRQSKDLAATLLQKVMRGKIARKLIVRIERERIQKIFATKIQALVRGFVTRKTIDTVLENKKKYGHAMKIQAIVRGFITRLNISKKLAELKEHRHYRNKSATTIGAAYRGYRCRLIYKMMLLKMNKVRSEENRAVTIINTMVRGFLGRLHLRQLYQERREMWIRDARLWQEMWSDDSASWFYFNAGTGVALWEPSKSGYTKSDGMLVLTSGEIIEDPLVNLEENSEVDAVREQKKQNRLCSECAQRVAIRNCSECGDKFCTKCYKATHATGARRKHNFTATGPLDCTECELVLAERWCVSCDEAYCDSCWRKVHSRGKRRFHPFSEVSDEGRIDSRIYTIDGEEVFEIFLFNH